MIKYKSGYKYHLVLEARETVNLGDKQIVTQWIVYNPNAKTLWIRSGYAWDGASFPAIDTDTNMRASLFHDALYQLLRMGLLDKKFRKTADKLFRDIAIEAGMSKIRARLDYWGLRSFAGFAAKPDSAKEIHIAP